MAKLGRLLHCFRRALIRDTAKFPSDHSAMYHLIIALRHFGQSVERDRIEALVKRLSESQQASRQLDTNRKRFKLIEQQPEPPK
jgi:uncharacterized protein (DUF488 family)